MSVVLIMFSFLFLSPMFRELDNQSFETYQKSDQSHHITSHLRKEVHWTPLPITLSDNLRHLDDDDQCGDCFSQSVPISVISPLPSSSFILLTAAPANLEHTHMKQLTMTVDHSFYQLYNNSNSPPVNQTISASLKDDLHNPIRVTSAHISVLGKHSHVSHSQTCLSTSHRPCNIGQTLHSHFSH